ncbi:MAG: hypothetical protein ACI4NQ_03370, partial [Christensenellales bacterium]
MKKRNVLIACMCILAAAVITLAVALPKSHAAIGREARKRYDEYEERLSKGQDDLDEDEKTNDDSLVFWFPVPEGYLDKKSDDRKYVSKINAHDTPEEWKALEDVIAMREASQVPSDVIDTVSTDELVLYCMNYNLFADIFLFNTMQDGMDSMRINYNGLSELINREDAAECLIRLYKLYDLDTQSVRDESSTIRFHYLESMLCMPEILDSLTADQSKELAAACADKINQIVNDENCIYSASTTMYLAAISQYETSEEFASIIDASSGAKRYVEEGILVPDEISDSTIGEIISYFAEIL